MRGAQKRLPMGRGSVVGWGNWVFTDEKLGDPRLSGVRGSSSLCHSKWPKKNTTTHTRKQRAHPRYRALHGRRSRSITYHGLLSTASIENPTTSVQEPINSYGAGDPDRPRWILRAVAGDTLWVEYSRALAIA